MVWYGDPDALDAVAAELGRRARSVREATDRHRRAGVRARWVSEAASAYRGQMAADCVAVDAAADAMDDAAAALRRHADEVRERQAAIAHAEREVRAWLAGQADRVGELAGDVGDVVAELPDAGADAWRHVWIRLSRLGAG